MQAKTRIAVMCLAASAAFFTTVKVHEGFTASPIIPTKGDVPTIGHGTTVKPDGTRVKLTDPAITRQTADKWMRAHVSKDEAYFKSTLGAATLHQYEYDAYLDFMYQFGRGNWSSSSMLRNVKNGQYRQACDALLRYKFSAGRDCSLKQNSRICGGVWTRQQDRHKWCLGIKIPKA